jgi:hypothetical protein
MNELPDYLPGNPPMYGIKQEATQYYQGASINITAILTEDGVQVDQEDYVIKAVIKSNLDANNAVWQGFPNCGIFFNDNRVTIKVPNSVTAAMPGGIYYLALVGVSKLDPSHTAILFTKTLSINPSAASELPYIIGGEPTSPLSLGDGVSITVTYSY